MFESFGFIVVLFFIVFAFGAFRMFSRVGSFQNRIFDLAERQMELAEEEQERKSGQSPDYQCDQCGGTLENKEDVNEDGSFTCPYCGKLSHIHS